MNINKMEMEKNKTQTRKEIRLEERNGELLFFILKSSR